MPSPPRSRTGPRPARQPGWLPRTWLPRTWRPRAWLLQQGLVLALPLAGLGSASCAPGDPQAASPGVSQASDPGRSWPPGTVLAVGATPITADEVDRDSALVQQLLPDASERDLRRKALMRLTLPRAIGLELAGERRGEVQLEARALRERLIADIEHGPIWSVERSGGYGEYDLAVWGAALETPVGQWTPVVDVGGILAFAKVLERKDHSLAAGVEFKLELVRLAYLDGDDPLGDVERAQDDLELTIVDPQWRLIVPELTQYRMGVHD